MSDLPLYLQWAAVIGAWAAFVWLVAQCAGINRLEEDDELEAQLQAHGSTPIRRPEYERNIFAGQPLDTTAKWHALDPYDHTDRTAESCDMEAIR